MGTKMLISLPQLNFAPKSGTMEDIVPLSTSSLTMPIFFLLVFCRRPPCVGVVLVATWWLLCLLLGLYVTGLQLIR